MKYYGLLSISILLMLAGCGGGNTQVAEGGIGGTGVSQGKVSGYGSIFVNGIEYNTDSATFIIEEDASGHTQDEIKLGMVVQVTGENNGVTGTAAQVEYRNQLKGILTAPANLTLDADGIGTLEVMQQIVHVSQTTVFEDNDPNLDILITDLVANDLVEVSGYSDGSGTIYATRIELISRGWSNGSQETLELKGVVSNLSNTQSFKIGDLIVDYSSAAAQPDGLPDGTPEAGWYVEVRGNSFTTSNHFEAGYVEIEGDGNLQIADNDQEVEMEGVVTDPLVGDSFKLNGQPVSIANLSNVNTTAITLGREMQVEGTMVDGTIEATEIAFEAVESELQDISSSVQAIDPVDLNSGTLTLLGQSITVSSSTIMEDDLGDDQVFNFAEILPGQFVEVVVYKDGNKLTAVKLERESVPDPLTHEIEGVVEEIIDSATVRILGVTVVLPATTATPALGDRLDITGVYDANTAVFTATTAEVEAQDD